MELSLSDISFNTKSVFGRKFTPGIKVCVGVVGSMMNKSLLQVDGTISQDIAQKVRKSEIWSYVYYLWYYNKDVIRVFEDMTSFEQKKPKAIGEKFAIVFADLMEKSGIDKGTTDMQLKSVFTKERILITLNKLVRDNPSIKIPILQRLYKQLLNSVDLKNSVMKNMQVRLNQVQVRTAKNAQNNVKWGDNVKNADVKIQIGVNIQENK